MRNWTLQKILRSPKERLNGGSPHRVQKINCTSYDKRKSDYLETFDFSRHGIKQDNMENASRINPSVGNSDGVVDRA